MARALAGRIKTLEQVMLTPKETHYIKKPDGACEYHLTDLEKTITKYTPTPTGVKFHDDKSFFKLLIGPYGSGKTTICLNDLVLQASEMPKYKGRREARFLCIRNTRPELLTTTYFTWQQWFKDLGNGHSRENPILSSTHIFNDDEGEIKIELIFLAMDDEDALKKLESLEVTGAYVNELRHLPEGLLSKLSGRVGRYPPMAECEAPYQRRIIADTNPPSARHWLYHLCEVECPESYKVFKQPPGLVKDSNDKWIENVNHDTYKYQALDTHDYYLQMAVNATEEFVKVYCLGDYGTDMAGKPVFPSYNDDLHSAPNLKPIRGIPIMLSLDFGNTPAAHISQVAPNGRIMVLKEFIGNDMGIRRLAESHIIPYLKSNFDGYEIKFSVGDPAGNAKSQTDEKTCIQILNDFKTNKDYMVDFKAKGAKTNAPVPRLDSVDYFLNRLIEGKGAIVICRDKCPVTRDGFMGGYHYKKLRNLSDVSNIRYHDTPEKNEYSHPLDSIQYLTLELLPVLSAPKHLVTPTQYVGAKSWMSR